MGEAWLSGVRVLYAPHLTSALVRLHVVTKLKLLTLSSAYLLIIGLCQKKTRVERTFL